MIIVTGGAGFIGSWLCEDIVKSGKKVVAVDNFCTGTRKNIEHLTAKSFKILNNDVTKPVELSDVDEIYHLASPASPIDYQKLSIETMLANSIGTLNMLEIARRNNARFLLASTSEVYGDPKEHPQQESYWGNVNPVGPRACYDESKRFAEALTTEYRRRYGMETRIARIFNTYGPRMRKDDGRVMPTFITQALHDNEITVNGDGSQTRSFCYVSDMVSGLTTLMKKGNGLPTNIGNPNEITVLELAKRIIEITKSKSKITFTSMPQDDPAKRKPDITRIKQLGWQAEIGLKDGIASTVEYFKRAL